MNISLSKLWELVIGKPGVLQSTGSQIVEQDWAIELTWISIAFPGAEQLDVQLSINRMVSIVLFDGIVMKMKWGQEYAKFLSGPDTESVLGDILQ